MTFTAEEKLGFLQRETDLCRRRCMHKMASGGMTKAEADRRIALMSAIREDYREWFFDDLLEQYRARSEADG